MLAESGSSMFFKGSMGGPKAERDMGWLDESSRASGKFGD